jgi:hypothetical protein
VVLRTSKKYLEELALGQRPCMKNLIIRYVESGVKYAPPAVILGASLLNLTLFQRQYLMLVLIIWVNMFFLFKVFFSQ